MRVFLKFRATMNLKAGKGMGLRAADLGPALRDGVDKEIITYTIAQFVTQGSRGGTPWARLRPSTVERKVRRGTLSKGIGRDSDQMWSSLTKPNGAGALVRITDESYSRSSAVPWFASFTKGVPGKQVARPIYPDPLPADLVERIRNVVANYIVSGKTNNPNAAGANVKVEF